MHECSRILRCTERPIMVSYCKVIPYRLEEATFLFFLIGDSAYPLLPWLLKPFPFSISMPTDHKTYNYRLSRGWVIVEIAFGRLKARWRRLSKQIDMDISNVPNVILACCTLHNICEIHNDSFNDEWLQQSNDFDQPDSTDAPVSTRSNTGNRVRDLLMMY